ncbi:hypothetical protein QQF64_023192 [Cirrhinus molitorella]|uniref:Uncharacterized protein n=1 Tax=Cirrhinus molitorella TaxID=172907 RepID=A0ABR3L6V3_9TELE
MAKAFLYPRVGYVPKVPTSTPQSVVLQAFCPSPFTDPDQKKLNCICPDICNAAGWSTPLTFARFYDLDLRDTPGSYILLP